MGGFRIAKDEESPFPADTQPGTSGLGFHTVIGTRKSVFNTDIHWLALSNFSYPPERREN